MKKKLYQEIAVLITSIQNCYKAKNHEWAKRHIATINKLVADFMPSGSGLDTGTKMDHMSEPNTLIFNTAYHHMNESGFYDGWTEHKIIVKPSLAFGMEMRITGQDRNDIKEHLHEVYREALEQVITPAPEADQIAGAYVKWNAVKETA